MPYLHAGYHFGKLTGREAIRKSGSLVDESCINAISHPDLVC